MKKGFAAFFAVCTILLALLPGVYATAADGSQEPEKQEGQEEQEEPRVSVINGCHSLDAMYPVMGSQRIVENMDAGFLYDVEFDTVLYALNPDMPLYPASLVKMLTAVIALEKGNLEDKVVVRERAISSLANDAISIGLKPNEELSLKDLLYSMSVGSANDSALVIADHISGSVDAFVTEMNDFAKEIGCTGSVFTNPHGLHDAAQVVTARDMAKIVRRGLEHPEFLEAFSATYYNMEATNLSEGRHVSSNNYLIAPMDNSRLYIDLRVVGGRTGLTNDDARCIAAIAQDNDRTLISIVMGSRSKYSEDHKTTTHGGFLETTELLDLGFDNYKPLQVLYEGQIFRQCAVANGENEVVIGGRENAFTVLPNALTDADLTYRYLDEEGAFTAPVEKGQKLSSVQVWYGNICVADTELFAMSQVRMATPKTDNAQNTDSGIWKSTLTVIGAIAGGLVLTVLGIRLVGKLRLAAVKRRGRRYRMNRRRSR